MPGDPNAARLLRRARSKAGLTQRELATRAGTTRSVVARIERGQTRPRGDMLIRLLAAAGWEAEPDPDPVSRLAGASELDDVPRILALTPEQRLLEVRNVSRFATAARRV